MRTVLAFLMTTLLVASTRESSGSSTTTSKSEESWTQHWSNDDSVKDLGYYFADRGKHVSLAFGSDRDREDGDSYRRSQGTSYLWLRAGKDRYLTNDPATLDRVKEILQPQVQLSEEQARLGQLQGKLGREQAELGSIQASLASDQVQFAARQAALAAQTNDPSLSEGARRDLQKQLSELSSQQEALGRRQTELGDHQTRMGKDQKRMGDMQAEASGHMKDFVDDVRRDLLPLIRQAAAAGKAKKL